MNAPVSPPPTSLPILRFVGVLESTPQAARRARHAALRELADWGWPLDSEVSRTAALIVAELTANAVIHGSSDRNGFRLCLAVLPGVSEHRRLRIEVTDACGACVPQPTPHVPDAVSGRGLLLVAALSDRWGWAVSRDHSSKTVWAELALGTDAN
ncbi:ATP-binding protein [Yinghuangia sp. YIM S10712]|uniref:ATP-binding protein n=1 Tax=Yinghuangia sp. YIM S10712 TaxID=3436930 RepID=UPI003F52A7FA